MAVITGKHWQEANEKVFARCPCGPIMRTRSCLAGGLSLGSFIDYTIADHSFCSRASCRGPSFFSGIGTTRGDNIVVRIRLYIRET